jgi:iron complex transport system ATP-binding protein
MIQLRDIHFRHEGNGREILRGVSFGTESGRMTTILGPNGSGKTTLFKCITGAWRQQRGTIVCDGRDISTLAPERRARTLAVVPQEHEPPFPYSVFDAVLMGRASRVALFSTPGKPDRDKTEEAIETVGIGHLADRPYTKISGGERQLVLIARALAQEAPLMLLDEPTSHLDFRNQVLTLRKVRDIVRKRGLTVLMTLHDPNLAMQFSDSVVLLNNGTIVAVGAPDDVISAESLGALYGIEVTIIRSNGAAVVCPRATA